MITAQKDDKVNTMTASWGGTDVIWNKNVVIVYIRNSRYTKKFVDDEDRFSLCVLPETYRKELAYCGKVSGRDEDKIAKCGFTVKHNNGVPFFKESRLVINCKKLYAQQMQADCFTKEGKNLPCNTVQRVCCAFWIMLLRKRISGTVIKRVAQID